MQFLIRSFNLYVNSWWIPIAGTYCILTVIGLCVFWQTGCVPLPWIAPVRWFNSSIDLLFLPLLALFAVSTFGMIIAASNQLQKRERKKGIAIFFIFLISLLLSILGLLNLFIILMGPIWCSQTPRSKAYAVEVTQDLAELAPLPKSATHIKTEMKGGAFDRTVVVTFEALKSDIEEWLMASQGTSELVPEKLPDKSLKYSISSGNGGQVALLVLSADKRKVKIQVAYWL